ncbi:Peptidase C14 caspase catalytic subunit [Streptomyces albidoflavus]|uniref:HD domain-containing protein n=1 Tax=Streptomyces TaxID=1883 RepID=UPI0001AED298|nr:caspase family protein [Streptomyces albidoflavus]BDH52206.1 hypothetical protein MTP02_32170 [Streptomyces albus]AGI89476.1 Peptidase C14 caspase catalytic subunit [Streptomyces albidoflavus]EFE82368.1 peptidase C14 caspase catalytic subunit [Streptomyces albidoflavus]QLP93329.1 Peptidase C14 caspase catalytic subunit [Streptomyces albidoflavus]WAE11688.1 Peptidase C14 caspase catalytic subunit [Streptomyces albidoflavus]
MDDSERIALLVGVGENPDAEHVLPSLAATVAADLRVLGAALEGSGYAVETLLDPTRNAIAERISTLSLSAPPGSTLLLYFTGHGVRIGTTDYLVPSDARAPADTDGVADGWEQPHVRESLLEADISRYLSKCRADTVLWLIDACRWGQQGPAFGSNVIKGPPHSGFAMMTGCGPGEPSAYAERGSFFTSALAHAFDPLTEATTVEQVYEQAKRDTRTLSMRAQAGTQQVLIHYGTDLAERTKALQVAEGRRLLELWQDVVRAPALWERVPDGDAETVAHFQDCLSSLAAEAARHVHRAQKRLPDPWTDDEFPVRLLADRLPQLLPKDAELSALEVAALIADVLLYETAWAERLSQAAELVPQLVRRRPEAGAQRRHYEQITEHYPQITEKLTDSYRWLTDPTNERHAVTLWLVHRWIEDRFATDEEAVPAVLADGFVARLLDLPPSSAGEALSGRAAALSTALRAVAAGLAVGAPPDHQQLLPGRHVVRRTPSRLRVRPLAALLRLAGVLAFDTRQLPEILAEHIAVSDPVVPSEVVSVLRDALWVLDQDGSASSYLHLDAVCPHPAIHAALASVVEDADGLGDLLRESARHLPREEAALLSGLPSRWSDQGLRADQRHGVDAYDVPLARFSLAQTEIRRLLMGDELYEGKPHLALRELYQNAMDACRYREMRSRYLRGVGREQGDWAGRIRIEMGEDSRGLYIECVDNGVGMTADQLKSTFTRAGRRFDQSHSFRREQAAWLRHDSSLRLYPNSRFGIGVFSYFMLAEEMTIVTRPVDPDGRPAAKALRVEIPVSGSLFRVREEDEREGVALPGGGTRVRLHLRRTAALPGNSAVSVLCSLVLISEFRLEVRDLDGTEEIWLPGQLKCSESKGDLSTDFVIEAVPGTLWWVSGDGAIVCDGISAGKRTFGYVLNLSGQHAGELSVNREKLKAYDARWAAEQHQQGARVLAGSSELRLQWLWAMESREPSVARTLWKALRGQGALARDRFGRHVNLDEVGWFRMDASLKEERGRHLEDEPEEAIRPWRLAALGPDFRTRNEAVPLSLSGHPVPQPGWSDIVAKVGDDWRSAVLMAYEQGITVAEVLHASRCLRLTHPRLSGPAVVGDGDLDWEPEFIDWCVMKGALGSEGDPVDDLKRLTWGGPRLYGNRNSGRANYQHSPGDLSGIVQSSAYTRRPLGELAEACARYAPFVGEPLSAVPAHHRHHVCTDSELRLLYLREDERSWRPAIHPWDVPLVADATDLDVDEVQRRMAAFAWLGRPVPELALATRWAEVPQETLSVMPHYLVLGAGGRLELSWGATIELAADCEVTVWEAERALAREADRVGVVHHRRYTKRSPGRDVIPSPVSGHLTRWLHAEGIRLEDGVSLRDLAFVRSYEISFDELACSLDELREAGVDLPDAAKLLRAWDELPMPSRYAFSGEEPSWTGADYPVPATSAVLFTGSQRLRQRLSVLWDIAQEEALNLGLDAALVAPRPPEQLATFVPTWDETGALVESGPDEDSGIEWFESPHWVPLTAKGLVGYARARTIGARAAYQALAPFRAIGALVPELTAEAEAGLPEDVPTAHDAVAVDPAYRVSEPSAPLQPLDLVSIAGRLGESVRDTWQRRITPYLALQEAGSSIVDVPHVVPCWQDLAILSEGHDGKLPALTGDVGRDRVERCARAVGETPGWVRRRLETYAGMFALRLEGATDEGDRP